MNRFEECLSATLGYEGGFSDEEGDHGGRTNLGITQGTLDSARADGIVSCVDVADLTVREAADIYRARYWDVCKCGELFYGLDMAVFDSAVNHGTGGAGRLLQKTVNHLLGKRMLVLDGAIGPNTLKGVHEALGKCARGHFLGSFLFHRFAFYLDIVNGHPDQRKFLLGWMRRLDDLVVRVGL